MTDARDAMPESDRLHVELPYLPPAEFSRNSRCHWRKLHQAQQQVNNDMKVLVLEAGWQGQPMQRATVEVTLWLPDRRRRDWDNLATRLKPTFDALVTAGVLADDSLEAIGVPQVQVQRRARKPGTEILVTRLDD